MIRLLFAFTLVVLVVGLGAGYFALGPRLHERILPGVWVWDVPLGGVPAEDAPSHIAEGLALDEARLILTDPEGRRWAFSPADLGVSVQLDATVERAYAPGHAGGGAGALFERLEVMREGVMVTPVLVWDQKQARAQLRTLASQLDAPARDARVVLDGASLRLEPSAVGRRVDVTGTLALLPATFRSPAPREIPLVVQPLTPEVRDDEAAQALDVARAMLAEPLELLLSNPEEGDPGPWTLPPERLARMLEVIVEGAEVTVRVDDAQLRQYLEPLALALHRAPVDAQFRFDGEAGRLVPLGSSRVGRELDVDATIARINEQLLLGQHHVPLVVQGVPPTYPETASAADLGIRELVAVGESYFAGSSNARDHNIRLGSSKFDGVIIGPGETFSFNEILGEVTPDEGYDESYVIIGDQTVPGVGGGICQVATTAFRAAFDGGYQIVERWPHAYRVGYYELGGFGPGFDATIYTPLVDFRFVNDSPHHLLVETEVDAARSRLRFLFYSSPDGRTVEQIGPTWGEPEPPDAPVYVYNPEMAAGTVTQVERAHDGLRAELGRVVRDAEGNVLHEDLFKSHFIPWPARFEYGPGFTPPPGAVVEE